MQAIREFDLTDVVVQVQPAPEEGARDQLHKALAAQPGVSRVQIHGADRALVIVDFDPRAISPIGILRCVHAQGHLGRLLGV
ncbi:MAG: hypothetical protein R3357_14725 [Burkholderiales bacterium]|nr:hypothetical protein [Burkholderiales bacterium]